MIIRPLYTIKTPIIVTDSIATFRISEISERREKSVRPFSGYSHSTHKNYSFYYYRNLSWGHAFALYTVLEPSI